MKRLISSLGIVILVTSCPQQGFSQSDSTDDPYFNSKVTYEIGGSLGVMNCLTDLGGGKGIGKNFIKDINLGNTEPAGSIFLGAAYKKAILLRTELTWGIVKASDAVLKGVKESVGGRYERNLSFRSAIFEVSLVSEIHPRYFKNYSKSQKLPKISPYLLGGIGYFSFNPQARLEGKLTNLRPFSTEGQGFAEYPDRKFYKLKQINFPVGAGVKYKCNAFVNFSAECVYRILNTDYLDDVSTTYIDKNVFQKYFAGDQLNQALLLHFRQNEINPAVTSTAGDIRGNSKKNDAYFSVNFKVALVF